MKSIYCWMSVCIILIILPMTVSAQKKNRQPAYQDNDTSMRVELRHFPILGLGKPYADRIALRWTAGDADMLRALLHDGILIDRLRIDTDNKAIGGWERITPDTVRAWSKDEFEQRVTERDTALLILAQSIYGKPTYPEGLGIIELAGMQRMERENRLLTINLYAALSEEAAHAAGLAFDDWMAVDTTCNYVYKIFPATVEPHVVMPDTGYVFVAGIDRVRHPIYEGLEAVNRDGAILIKWPGKYQDFTGYFIDRSEDSLTFRRLNKVVYIPSIDSLHSRAKFSYMDSVRNGREYYYRLTGVTPFGEFITFRDVVKGKGIDLTPPSVPLFSHTESGDRVTFTWQKPDDSDLLGYHIVRGMDVQSVDTLLTASGMLAPDILEYSFKKSEQPHSSFYRLMVMDESYNSAFSEPVYIFSVDTVPPAATYIVSGNIDSTGVVTVRWAHLKDEPDLRGYKVLFANDEDHNFAPASNIIPDTVYEFHTSLRTFTPHLYVKVIAVDANYNHGFPSEAFQLTRPDTIPPRTPVILGYENLPSGVSISWSPSVDLSFDRFVVFCRTSGQDDWKQIAETSDNHYTDTTVIARKSYEYSLTEVDKSGNRSAMAFPQTIVTSAPLDEDLRLTRTYELPTKTVHLSWTKPARKASAIILFKDEGEGLTMYERIDGEHLNFSEAGSPDTIYGIKIVYHDNSESPLIK